MKKVIVACGNGVATSQTVMELLPISILQIVIWIMEFLLLTDLLFSQESIKKKRFKNLSKS